MQIDSYYLDVWNGSYTEPVVLGEKEKAVMKRLEADVRRLAEDIGERNTGLPEALEEAAGYIEARFRELDLQTTSQGFTAGFEHAEVRNIEAIVPGSDPNAACLVIGAHYDSAHGTPGANDNASGVAALLEVAASLAEIGTPRRTVRLVAFTNEEPPFFGGPEMGSWVYADGLARSGVPVMGMICLECLGYYSPEPGSQNEMPATLKPYYGNTIGNFVAFCGNPHSRDLTERALNAFRASCPFPSEGLAVPKEMLPGLDLSDHVSFWRAGMQAVMVTDTVYYRYSHYHAPTDTADGIAYPSFARVTAGLGQAVRKLAEY